VTGESPSFTKFRPCRDISGPLALAGLGNGRAARPSPRSPDASIDLLDAQGPAGVRFPMFILRFRGSVHRSRSCLDAADLVAPRAPAWHFSAQDARLAIDGVVRAELDQMVQVQYAEPERPMLHCTHTAIASMEVRVRSVRFPEHPGGPGDLGPTPVRPRVLWPGMGPQSQPDTAFRAICGS